MSTPNANLSQAASAVQAVRRSHAIAAEYDAAFDAGEWSGPAHARLEVEQCVQAVEAHGFTASSYNRTLKERTNARFAHFSNLLVHEGEES